LPRCSSPPTTPPGDRCSPKDAPFAGRCWVVFLPISHSFTDGVPVRLVRIISGGQDAALRVWASLVHAGCPKLLHPGYLFCNECPPSWVATSHSLLLCPVVTKSAVSAGGPRPHGSLSRVHPPPTFPPGEVTQLKHDLFAGLCWVVVYQCQNDLTTMTYAGTRRTSTAGTAMRHPVADRHRQALSASILEAPGTCCDSSLPRMKGGARGRRRVRSAGPRRQDPYLHPSPRDKRGLTRHHKNATLRLPRMRSSKTTFAGASAIPRHAWSGNKCSSRG